ncbi:MAG: acetoacetyl-CoA reductase, partial [Thermoleophilaceae bacterium]|nr:acetoacetyl-CoA reductase [Thermoleophilaceae bacterium]
MAATETAPRAAGTGPRKLEGRVALVTGGTRGIGAAVARSLAEQGAIVAAGYTSNDEAAERFLEEFGGEDFEGSVHKGNVASCEDCRRVVEEVLDKHDRLDILVNNAGITADKPILKMSVEDWEKVIQVNLNGSFYMSKPALEHMIERGSGRIVNISSIIGQMGNVGQANYAASK